MVKKKFCIYRKHNDGKMQLIGHTASAIEAIDIAGEHYPDIEHAMIIIRSEPEEGSITE